MRFKGLGLVLFFATFAVFTNAALAAPASTVIAMPTSTSIYQDLSTSPLRLTHLAYGLFAANQFADSPESRARAERFLKRWNAEIYFDEKAARDEKPYDPRSSRQIRFELFERRKFSETTEYLESARFFRVWLSQGCSEPAKGALGAIDDLEDEPSLAVRLTKLAAISTAMTRDENLIPVARVVLEVLRALSKDLSTPVTVAETLAKVSVQLAEDIEKSVVRSHQIDLLAPENLIGGAIGFRLVRWLGLPQMARQLLLKRGATAVLTPRAGIAAATVAAHIGVGVVATQPSKDARVKPTSESASSLFSAAGRPLTTDAVHRLAEKILYSKPSFEIANLYATLFAGGERFLKRDAVRDIVAKNGDRQYTLHRDVIVRQFDSYMASRSLKVVDAEAIRHLRGLVAKFVGEHSEQQTSVLYSTSYQGVGNCVARAMNMTAFFYPAYAKYENPDLRYGLMIWEDHIEAVLWDRQKETITSVVTGDRLESQDELPAVLEPRVFAAAYLYREKSPELFAVERRHLPEMSLHSRSYLVLRSPQLSLSRRVGSTLSWDSDLTTREFDRDPNRSPFTSARYADPLIIPAELQRALNWNGPAKPRSSQMPASASVETNGTRRLPPGATILSRYEYGEVVFSENPSLFPIVLTSQDVEMVVPGSGKNVPDLQFAAGDYYVNLLASIDRVRGHSHWRPFVLGQVASIAEFSRDLEFIDAAGDVALFYDQTTGSRDSYTAEELIYLEFRRQIGDELKVRGLGEELKGIERTAVKVLAPLAQDQSGRRLKDYLEQSMSVPLSERVQIFRGLGIAHELAEKSDPKLVRAFDDVMGRLKLKVVPPKAQNAPDKKERPRVSFQKAGPPVMMIQLQPSVVPHVKADLELRLDAQTMTLFIAEFAASFVNGYENIFAALAELENAEVRKAGHEAFRVYVESFAKSERFESRASRKLRELSMSGREYCEFAPEKIKACRTFYEIFGVTLY